jgi:hypothetical protein
MALSVRFTRMSRHHGKRLSLLPVSTRWHISRFIFGCVGRREVLIVITAIPQTILKITMSTSSTWTVIALRLFRPLDQHPAQPFLPHLDLHQTPPSIPLRDLHPDQRLEPLMDQPMDQLQVPLLRQLPAQLVHQPRIQLQAPLRDLLLDLLLDL